MAESGPFARPVRVESISADGLTQAIEASEAERAALAKLNGLPGIARLTASFTLNRAGRGLIRVRGQVHAELTQACVVSLEPVEARLDEPVDVRFAVPAGESASRRGPPISAAEAESLSLDGEDAPDPVVDGKIDLGALAAEFMVLALDPYPRKPGADFAPPAAEGEGAGGAFGGLGDGAKEG
jgi:uncharacterized metal-binding protein YceD (DUF177 family)